MTSKYQDYIFYWGLMWSKNDPKLNLVLLNERNILRLIAWKGNGKALLSIELYKAFVNSPWTDESRHTKITIFEEAIRAQKHLISKVSTTVLKSELFSLEKILGLRKSILGQKIEDSNMCFKSVHKTYSLKLLKTLIQNSISHFHCTDRMTWRRQKPNTQCQILI